MGSTCSVHSAHPGNILTKRFYFIGEPGTYDGVTLAFGQEGQYVGPSDGEGFDFEIKWAGGKLHSRKDDVSTVDPFGWGEQVFFSAIKPLPWGQETVKLGQELYVLRRTSASELVTYLKEKDPSIEPKDYEGTGLYVTRSPPTSQLKFPEDWGVVNVNGISKQKPSSVKTLLSFLACRN